MEILQWIYSIGGVGAVFGFLMYFALKMTFKTMRDDRKFMEDRLTKVLDDYSKSTQDNTKVLTELYTYLRIKNGKG